MRNPRHPATLTLGLWTIAIVASAAQPAPARYYNPRFSEDGQRVIFESTRDGKYTVYTINVDGSALTRVTDSKQDDSQPQWSADARAITFTSPAGNVNKVFVMASDGSGRRQISSGPKHDAAPSFSKDGLWVAWAATTEAPADWRDIGVKRVDSSADQRLITSGPGNDQAPVWISSNRLVFVREFPPKTDWRAMTPEEHAQRRASSELMAINADGSNLVNLTNNGVEDSTPTWASALNRLFFTSTRDGTRGLYSMRPDGSDVRRVADMSDAQPAISPDGRLVTYSAVVSGRSGIFVRNLQTGTARELVGGEKPAGGVNER